MASWQSGELPWSKASSSAVTMSASGSCPGDWYETPPKGCQTILGPSFPALLGERGTVPNTQSSTASHWCGPLPVAVTNLWWMHQHRQWRAQWNSPCHTPLDKGQKALRRHPNSLLHPCASCAGSLRTFVAHYWATFARGKFLYQAGTWALHAESHSHAAAMGKQSSSLCLAQG